MDWPRLDTRAWNLSIGAAATTMLAACGPFITLDGETDTASETDTDPNPTDPDATDTTTPVQCNNASDCQPGEECIDNVCMPYDYYCADGCCDGGCCYDDCCYGECYYSECYSDEECGPLGLCSTEFGYGQCQTAQPLGDCGGGPDVAVLELPTVSGGAFVSLAFVDANGDAAQDVVVGRDGSAELHMSGGAPPTTLPVPLDAAVVDAVSGDFDGDGDNDLVLSTADGRLLVLAQSGGLFSLVSEQGVASALYDLVALQWNGDGWLDVAGVTTSGAAMMHWGGGDGTFIASEILTTYGDVYSMARTDFRSDDYGDLVVEDQVGAQVFLGDFSGDLTRDFDIYGNLHGERRVLSANIGGGSIYEVVGYTPKPGWLLLELWNEGLDGPYLYGLEDDQTAIADMGDYNGDGRADVIVAGSQEIHYLRGDDDPGASILTCRSSFFLGAPASALAVGDHDGNGLADVVIQSGGTVLVLLTQ